jgi:hypothetical protein
MVMFLTQKMSLLLLMMFSRIVNRQTVLCSWLEYLVLAVPYQLWGLVLLALVMSLLLRQCQMHSLEILHYRC